MNPLSRLLKRIAVCFLFALFSEVLVAQPTSSSVPDEEQGIREAVVAYEEAWNKGDTAAVIALWVPDGQFIDDAGNEYSIKDLVERKISPAIPATEPPELDVNIKEVQLVTPRVAVVEGTTELMGDTNRTIKRTRYSAILVRQDNKWLLANVHQLEAILIPTSNPLQELQWMLGQWMGTKGDTNIYSRVERSQGGQFITRVFEVSEAGDRKSSGTQIIGWDPRTRQIKSWFFDSDGSLGEGRWEKYDKDWIVSVTGVLRDGRSVAATNVYTPIDQNNILMQSLRVRIGDETKPNTETYIVRIESK
jgi:uncharacterized protein (TIGR02246 family)